MNNRSVTLLRAHMTHATKDRVVIVFKLGVIQRCGRNLGRAAHAGRMTDQALISSRMIRWNSWSRFRNGLTVLNF